MITSGNDGKHGDGTSSLHYSNKAIDIRSNSMSDKDQKKVADQLQKKLGSEYRVISEYDGNDSDNDHIHVQKKAHKMGNEASVLNHNGAEPDL